MCPEIYELDSAHFLSAPGLASEALKKTKIRLELLTDVDLLLMLERRIRREIGHAIHTYAKANNKYMKNYNKDNESSCTQYLDENKLPVDGFRWVGDNQVLIKNLKNL